MTSTEILAQLEALGQPSIKKVLLKHDIKEPLFGVKVEELKKIRKTIKNGHSLALELYNSGIYDAMYLAGLIAEPNQMTPADLQHWAENATSPAIREYTVAWVAAESPYGLEKALEWIDSTNADLATTGWSTLSSIVTITDDKDLDLTLLEQLLDRAQQHIHQAANREKLAMNGFVMAVGIHVHPLHQAAMRTATQIGKVTADMGDTACKIPLAGDYIEKAASKNAIGKKKKSARCM